MRVKYFFVFVSMLIGIIANVNAVAADIITKDGITYSCADGKATVTDCMSRVEIADIPEKVSDISRSYKVTSIGEQAFSDCEKLKEVTIPGSVITIGNNAFSSCSNLAVVIIPNSVTTIGDAAFSQCSSLREVSIGNSVTSIGYRAFSSCTSLTEVAIPVSVSKIEYKAFANCSSLKRIIYNARNCSGTAFDKDLGDDYLWLYNTPVEEVIVGESVSRIPENAFYKCRALSTVTIPNYLSEIGSFAFYDCSSLTTISPLSVFSIGTSAFYGCSGLTEVSIRGFVSEIGDYTFHGCSSMKTVSLPESVTVIGKRSFFGCNSLTDITLPGSLSKIDDSAFSECGSLKSVTIPNSVTYLGYNCFRDCISLTTVKISDSLPKIAASTFWGCSSLTDVTISDSVTSIEECAFYLCSSLSEITIPEYVSTIGYEVFNGCSSLKTIYFNAENCSGSGFYTDDQSKRHWLYNTSIERVIIGESVSKIPGNAFYRCDRLTDLSILNSATEIGDYAFYNCKSLPAVKIPDSVTYIGQRAFSGCSSLVKLTLSNSLTAIDNNAFSDCIKLEAVAIPNSVTSVGNYAFSGCSGIKELIIGNSVEDIGGGAFSGCVGVQEVTIPKSVISIGSNAFSYCDRLKKIYYNAENCLKGGFYTANGVYYFDTTSIEEVIIGESVKNIPERAFFGCVNLKEIAIPRSVKSIGDYAFGKCQIQNVIIHDLNSWCRIQFGNLYSNPIFTAGTFCMSGSKMPVEHLDIDMPGETVSSYAFCGAYNLTTARIKALSVGTGCFYSCEDLTDLCLNLEKVESDAFEKASGIQNIYSMTSTPPAALYDAFPSYAGVSLFVPVGALSAYKNTEYCWHRFLDIRESDFKDIDSIFKEPESSGIKEVGNESSEFAVNTSNGYISVVAADSEDVEIYTMQGVIMHGGKGCISLYVTPGIYIVKSGNSVRKVLVE